MLTSYLVAVQPVVLPTAHRHGLEDDDILHAYRNAFRSFPDQGTPEITMLVGPARNGVTMLEVGYIDADGGQRFIVHAMGVRAKYR